MRRDGYADRGNILRPNSNCCLLPASQKIDVPEKQRPGNQLVPTGSGELAKSGIGNIHMPPSSWGSDVGLLKCFGTLEHIASAESRLFRGVAFSGVARVLHS